MDFIVVKSHPKMIPYIDSLQRKNAEALSFYPLQVFERELPKGRLYLGLLNNEPCGYLYAGSFRHDVKLHQVCIQYDARRKLYGAMIVGAMENDAIEKRSNSVQLRCGFDLDANKFWLSLGYRCIRIEDGGVRRMRKINIWRKQMQPCLFEDVHIEPAVGKTNSTFWRKNKQTGIVTGFHRGDSLKQYRAILEGADA